MKAVPFRFISIIALILLGIFTSPSSIHAQSDVLISVDDAVVEPDATIDVPINITPNGNTIGAVTLSIAYDSAVLSTTSTDCTPTAGLFGACNIPNAGEIRLSFADADGITAAMPLANVRFTAIGDSGQSSPLSITIITLTDTGAVALSNIATDNGLISIENPNVAPAADAGLDQTVIDSDNSGLEAITLDGSGSSDADGSIVSYVWSGIAGVIIPEIANPTVDVPVGSYNVTLTITDDNGATDTDDVTITVNEPANNAPVANAGLDQTVTDDDDSGDESITLDGSSSSDADGSIASYAWSGIPGVTIPGIANPTVDVPVGSYNVMLTVTDDDGATAIDNVAITVNGAPPITCGPLQQEAENGTLTGRFEIGGDANASGGSYIHAPDGSGNSGFGLRHMAEYCVTVAAAGDYRIKARVFSENGGSNSFFVTVNDMPASGYLFDVTSANAYVDDAVSNRNGDDPVILTLPVGDARITFHLREDGTRLDSFALEPFSGVVNMPPTVNDPGSQINFVGDTVTLQIEATDADDDTLTYSAAGLPAGLTIDSATGLVSGVPTAAGSATATISVSDGTDSTSIAVSWTISDGSTACGGLIQEAEGATLLGDFVIGAGLAASGGSFIHVPNGTGNKGFGSESRALFCFNVPAAGTYQLRGNVYADGGANDSFFVTMDNLDGELLWAAARNTSYETDLVNDRTSGLDPVTFGLEAGQVNVVVWLREDGTRLDTLALELVGSGPVNNPPTIDNPGNQTALSGSTISLQVNGNDIDGDTLTYSASGLPTGLSMNTNSGLISGVATVAGTFNSLLSVSDGTASTSINLQWIITDDSTTCGGLNQEAENGTLLGNFVAEIDANASGGSFVHVPEGTGNSNINTNSQAVYCFNVPATGNYRLVVSALADTGGSNSFFVRINGEPSGGYLFDLNLSTTYANDELSNRGGADPVVVTLPAGETQVVFYLREDGTRLDTVGLALDEPGIRNGASPSFNEDLLAWGILGSLTDMDSFSLSNGASDANDSALMGVSVALIDEATRGRLYQETVVTDAQGRFFFDAMPVGNYIIAVTYGDERLEEPVTASDENMVAVTFGLTSPDGQQGNNLSNGTQQKIFIPLLSR